MKFKYNFECFSNYSSITKRLKKEQLELIANDALQGRIKVQWGLPEIICKDGTIDWDIQIPAVSDSFQMRLQALSPISFLCEAYTNIPDQQYLSLANKIFDSWYLYQQNSSSTKNSYLWNDHVVAQRAETLIYFLLLMHRESLLTDNLYQNVQLILLKSGEWLADDNNYFKNCNHGIFEDCALIFIATLWDREDSTVWLNHAKKRLYAQKQFAFTEEMVHVENSPQYHETVLKLFKKIAEFLKLFSDPDGNSLYQDIQKSAEFLGWAIKPTGHLAEIGDSDGSREAVSVINRRFCIFDNDLLSYAATLGNFGSKPDIRCQIYPKAGYFFSRSSWEKDSLTEATWFMFKSGYKTRVHKHGDDLSIMLTSKGYDILIDSGKYGYMLGEPHVDYLHSPMGHNTIVVDEKGYSISNEKTHLVGISDYDLDGAWKYVRGFNDSYRNVSIDRSIYQKGDIIILYDQIESDTWHSYSQFFQLSEHIHLIEHSSGEIVGEIADTGYIVRINQLSHIDDIFIYRGVQDNLKYGYRSAHMGDIIETTTLRFERNAINSEFITIISIEKKGEKSTEIVWEKTSSQLVIDADRLFLSKQYRPKLEGINCEILQNRLYLSHPYGMDLQKICYRICDYKTNKVLKEETSDILCYNLDDDPVKAAKYITIEMFSKRNYCIKGIILYISFHSQTGKYYFKRGKNLLNLSVQDLQSEWVKKGTIRFSIITDYILDAKINWHIYKNGGHYYHEFGVNKFILEYTFKEEGTYTAMFYAEGIGGEKEFWNFPSVEISKEMLIL